MDTNSTKIRRKTHANNREWMLLVLLGPGMLDNGTNVIAKAVSKFLYYSAKNAKNC